MTRGRIVALAYVLATVVALSIITTLWRRADRHVDDLRAWQQDYCFMSELDLKDFARARLFASRDARMAASPWIHAHYVLCMHGNVAAQDRAGLLLQRMRETDDAQIARDAIVELQALAGLER